MKAYIQKKKERMSCLKIEIVQWADLLCEKDYL